MKRSTQHGLPALLLCAAAAFVPTPSAADDIDIFTGASGGSGADPKILIILDNTSNWSRASQQWPGVTIAGQGTWSTASTTVTTTGTFNTSSLVAGCTVAGTGIPSNTAIASISSLTSFTLSSATTAAGSSSQLTFNCPSVVQGQSEARAINTVLGVIGSNVNLGLMEFVTGGNANDDGGFLRQAIAPMTDANKTTFSTQLSIIFNNITDPNEKRNANTPYGDLMYDAWNYYTGGSSFSPGGVVASKADANGYTTNYTQFKSPLSDANSCGRNFVIFIGNPNASGPAADSAANGTALTTLGGSVSPQIKVPEFTSSIQTVATPLGFTSQCFASQASCTTTDFAAQCVVGGLYSNCSCSNTVTTTSLDACLSGTQRFSVYGNTNTGGTTTSTTTTSTVTNPTKGVTGCYATAAAATAANDHGGLSLPAGTTTTSGSTTTTTHNSGDTYAVSATASATATQNCAPTNSTPSLGSNQITYRTGTTTTCYGSLGTTSGSTPRWGASGDFAGVDTSCPAPLVTTSGNNTTTTTYTCAVTGALGTSCGGGKNVVNVTNTITGSPSTVTATPNYKFDVTQAYTQQAVAVTTSGVTTALTLLGNTSQCYAGCSTGEFTSTCSGYNGGCTCAAPTASAGQCASGARYMVTGNNTGTVVTPTGNFITPSTAANADEWARFMHQPKAINAASGTDTIKQSITTYTIDVFNKQQNAEETELYMSMARAGGGKYFSATTESAIVAALKAILAEIQSVNSTFASASLPVNATNRTQNANQVFIGMFRPDPSAEPRWYGNLKQYAIGKVGGDLDLVDVNGRPATNALTGFIDNCAVAFWTTNSVWPANSSNYWANIVVNPDPASNCDPTVLATLGGAVYSDLPDGPTVEKGAVAEILRKGNAPGVSPTWTTANRNMLALSGTTIGAFNSTSAPSLSSNLRAFTSGVDVNNDTGLYNASTNPLQTRPSIHGDVVHSRPLPVNYGAAGVTVYYGSNDGTLRAVDASNGKERWAFVAPEHYSKLQRLMDNSPGVDYNIAATPEPTFTKKSYFFDGSIGIYQAAAGSPPPTYIYPTQRRGGREAYGINVTDPTVNPALLWRHGCDDVGTCDTGFSQMGQTWSTPNVAFINGYSPDKTTTPVVVLGGGYDTCEDAQTSSPSCGSTTGNVVYFINATTGALITSFATDRAVAADVNLIDLNNDGLVDYAYVADTGGNVYRIDFISSPSLSGTPLTPTSAANNTATDHWYMHKVAYTNDSGGHYRKFLFGPGLFPTGTSNYVALVSGDREHPVISDYPYTEPVVNRAYIYKDDLTSTPSTAAVNLDGSDMLNQTSLSDATCTSRNLLTSTDKKGWYMDLTANGVGEQGVTAAVIVGGMVTFSTNRPLANNLACGTRLGEARGYFVNLFNGSGSISTANNASCGGVRSSIFAGGGLPPSPVIGLVPIDGVPTAVLIGAPPRDGGPTSPIKPTKIVPPINQTRTRTYKYLKGAD